MKGNFSFGKRLLSTALAAVMAATSMGTQVFAQPEATEESAEVQPGHVISWSWPEAAELDWVEEDQAWLFSCVYSEEQPLTEETLTQLLPSQITAVVQTPSVSQPENSSEMADSEATEEAVAVEENAAVFDSIATPDTSASDGGGAVSASAEDLGAGFSEKLGESASGTVDAVSQTLSLDLTWDFSGLSFPVQPGQYNLQASLPEGYLLETNASPLSLTLAVMPDNDLASDSGLCVHHPQHTTECGYAEGKSLCKFAQNGCPYCVVSWKWIDPDELLAEENGTWIMGMPGVNQDSPMTRDALGQMLPTQITATTQDGQNVTLALVWDLTALPEEGAVSGTYTVVAQLAETNENYALTEEASPLEVTLQLGGGETYSELPTGTPPYPEHIVNGVSPNGTTIDLFDYWLTEQTTSDAANPTKWIINSGINHEESDQEGTAEDGNTNAQDGHALIFMKSADAQKGSWNVWTNSANPSTGIVANKLENGYPKLNLDTSTVSDANMHRNGQESLAYLFDPNYKHPGKASYKDVQGLLQVDDEGYFYYDSQKNYATYYADTNSFTLYEYPGVIPGGRSPVGQFFPFNAANVDEYFYVDKDGKTYYLMNNSISTDGNINHYFGMHMSTRFIQQNGGYTDTTRDTPVTYEFAGDDDVWIFIDGKLVADLGGIHDRASVKIDFSTGTITINGESQNKNLGQLLDYGGNTLPDNTYHTLDFFYLERGNTDSNMSLKYNLVTIPESDLIKIDQLGDPVPGAQFSLYAANDINRAAPIATGTTDNKGEFVFLDDDTGMPITIDELYNQYGTIGNQTESDLVLVETYTPPGYRSGGEIGLYFSESAGGEVLLRSNSVWTEGAYAMPKVTASTKNVIRSADNPNDTVTLIGNGKEDNPIMFAVVFQKQGKDADGNTYGALFPAIP